MPIALTAILVLIKLLPTFLGDRAMSPLVELVRFQISEKESVNMSDYLNTMHIQKFTATYVFWRSVYLSNLFSLRNRSLVATDWIKKNVLGRDISRE